MNESVGISNSTHFKISYILICSLEIATLKFEDF